MITYYAACKILGIDPATYQPDQSKRRFEARFVAIYRPRGIIIPEQYTSIPLYEQEESPIRVILTNDIDQSFSIVQESNALANLMLFAFANQMQPDDLNSLFEQSLSIEEEKRRRQITSGPIIVCEGYQLVDGSFEFPTRQLSNFTVGFYIATAPDLVHATHDALAQAIAILAGADAIVSQLDPLGSALYLVDETGRKLHSVNPVMSATGYTSTPLNDGQIQLISSFRNLPKASFPGLSVLTLLSRSLLGEQDRYRRFLFAWTALEIFINTVFSSQRQQIFERFTQDIFGTASAQFLERVHTIADGKFSLQDRFVGVLSYLDCQDWRSLQQEFVKIKKIRDQYIHQKSIEDGTLPLNDVIALTTSLLRQYVLMKSKEPSR